MGISQRTSCALGAALAAAVLGAATPGCAQQPGPGKSSGAVGLQITTDGALSSASYTLTGPGGFSRGGKLDGAGKIVIDNVPPGAGYHVEVHGIDRDGEHHDARSGDLDVGGSGNTKVHMHLPCQPPKGTKGNKCPVIESISASPSETEVGSAIGLTASATDPDNKPKGGALSYQWSASFGTLTSAAAPSSAYTCTAGGFATLTFAVTDGDPDCTTTTEIRVGCIDDISTLVPRAAPTELPSAGVPAEPVPYPSGFSPAMSPVGCFPGVPYPGCVPHDSVAPSP
jgi:hypothetical protein